MSKVCKECGHQMDDNAKACPNCGCPNKDYSPEFSKYEKALNQFGKDTEAEETVESVAEMILKWGNILAVIALIMGGIVTLLSFGHTMVLIGNNNYGYGVGISDFLTPFMGIVFGIIWYFVIRIISKAIWAVMMLFVNMSVTLKRIELKNK